MDIRQLRFGSTLVALLAVCAACNRVGPPPSSSRPDRSERESEEAAAGLRASGPIGPVREETEDSPSDAAPDGSAEARQRLLIRPYDEWSVSETAADALGRIGASAVPDLIESLGDPDPSVRLVTSKILARIGPEAVLAVPNLVELLDDEDPQVRRAAIRALGQIGGGAADAVPALVPLLEETD